MGKNQNTCSHRTKIIFHHFGSLAGFPTRVIILWQEHVDWRYHLGEDVYVIIKAPQLTIHIRKHFVPNGEWTVHPTKRGETLSLYEWKELKKTYLYLKKENQNWELPMCKIKHRNEYLFVCYEYALSTLIQSVVSRHPKRQHE